MHYVYLLQSVSDPNQRYIGFTSNLKNRFRAHNEGGSIHTSKHKPWQLIGYVGLRDERKAREFEHYLKTGSGHAFAKKRFW